MGRGSIAAMTNDREGERDTERETQTL